MKYTMFHLTSEIKAIFNEQKQNILISFLFYTTISIKSYISLFSSYLFLLDFSQYNEHGSMLYGNQIKCSYLHVSKGSGFKNSSMS